MNINESLKKAREDKGISQRELGRRINKTGQYISYLEGNKKANPSLDLLVDIAEALEVPVNYLLGEEMHMDLLEQIIDLENVREKPRKLKWDDKFIDSTKKINEIGMNMMKEHSSIFPYKEFIHRKFSKRFSTLFENMTTADNQEIFDKTSEYVEFLLAKKEDEIKEKLSDENKDPKEGD